jgi:phosphate:Na+ symporter
MPKDMILGLVGGLGFFLFGMKLMSEGLRKVAEKEDAIDNLQREITRYLIELSRRDLAREEAQKLPVLLHTVNDIDLYIKFRQHHVRSLGEGKCQLLSGLVFLDFVQNLEKIGDHMTNIAQSVLGGLRWNGEA